jgi:hypothetical protein
MRSSACACCCLLEQCSGQGGCASRRVGCAGQIIGGSCATASALNPEQLAVRTIFSAFDEWFIIKLTTVTSTRGAGIVTCNRAHWCIAIKS